MTAARNKDQWEMSGLPQRTMDLVWKGPNLPPGQRTEVWCDLEGSPVGLEKVGKVGEILAARMVGGSALGGENGDDRLVAYLMDEQGLGIMGYTPSRDISTGDFGGQGSMRLYRITDALRVVENRLVGVRQMSQEDWDFLIRQLT